MTGSRPEMLNVVRRAVQLICERLWTKLLSKADKGFQIRGPILFRVSFLRCAPSLAAFRPWLLFTEYDATNRSLPLEFIRGIWHLSSSVVTRRDCLFPLLSEV